MKDREIERLNKLKEESKKLEEQKKAYEDMVAVSNTGEVQAASQLSNYNLDFLWTEIGTHATSVGVNINMALTQRYRRTKCI